MFHWSRPGVPRGGGGGGEGDRGRRAPIPARERSLRAATSHSRLPGDRGATDTRLGARGAGDQTLLYRLAKSTRVHVPLQHTRVLKFTTMKFCCNMHFKIATCWALTYMQ